MNEHWNISNQLQAAFAQVEQQQQSLIKAIFPSASNNDDSSFDKRGLAIYRNNLLATAKQALVVTFPTVITLIGEDLFMHACRQLLISSPPDQGDWGLWGQGFAKLLHNLPQLTEYPFVADIAQLDWLCHQSMREKNSVIDQASLQLLASTDLDRLYLSLTDHQYLMESSFPIIEFWLTHQHEGYPNDNGELKQQYLQQAITKLDQTDFQQRILVYRPNFKAEIRELSGDEYRWLSLMHQGVSIGNALDAMANCEFDFALWLGIALEQNLISHLYQ